MPDKLQPLKVTFRFRSPVVRDAEYPIHLDGLLAWCVMDAATEAGSADPWVDAENLDRLLGVESGADEWVWQASALHFTPMSERVMTHLVRRSDPLLYMDGIDRGLIQMRRTRNQITTASGQERAYHVIYPYQWMDRAEAWCIGARDAVTAMLNRLPAIGKMARNGYGAIESFSVEYDDDAEWRWRVRTLPMGVPMAESVEYVPAIQCPRPPYWRKMNRTAVMEPCIA